MAGEVGSQTDNRLFALSGWTTRRGQVRGTVLLVVTATIFWLLFRTVDLGVISHSLREIPPVLWGLALLLTMSFPCLSALRWHFTLRVMGYRIPARRCLAIILGTSPVSAVAPSKAGDLLKAVSLRGEVPLLEVAGGVLAERALDVLVLASLSLIGGVFLNLSLVTRLAAAVVALGLIGLLLLPHLVAAVPKPALRQKLGRALTVFRALRRRPVLAIGVAGLTVLNWLASIIQTDFLLTGVGVDAPFVVTVAVLPVAIFVGLIPITVGGMGTRDAALVTLLAPWASVPQALTVGLLYSFFGYWLLAVLGLPFLRAALFPHRPLPATDHARLSSG